MVKSSYIYVGRGGIPMYMVWNRAVKMSRLHKDQLCKSGALQNLSQPLTLLSPPLMEEAEAGAVEGWVTTGSRRLSKETKELGSSLIGAEWPRFRGCCSVAQNNRIAVRTRIEISTIPLLF